MLRVAVQEQLVPGETLIEKAALARHLGYDAIELRAQGDFSFRERAADFRAVRKAMGSDGFELPSLCVDMPYYIGADDDGDRRKAINNIKDQMSVLVQEAGGTRLVTPAQWGVHSFNLPPMRPKTQLASDRARLTEALGELSAHAEKEGGIICLEPLMRYTDHMVNKLSEAATICEAIGSPAIGINADFFHMNVEEDDMGQSLRDAGPHIKHIQIADSNRLQPGVGHLPWPNLLETVHDLPYDGYLAVECGLRGDPEIALQDAVDFLRSTWAPIKLVGAIRSVA